MELLYTPEQRDELERQLALKELASRECNGLRIDLMWDQKTDTTFIKIEDVSTGISRAYEIDSELAFEAFEHPFAYMPAETA